MGRHHHDEDAALSDGFNDRFGPEGGSVYISFVDPNGDTSGTHAINQRYHPFIVLAGITYKNLYAHKLGLTKTWIMQSRGLKKKEIIPPNDTRFRL
jgi:hypothetical protein